MPDWLIASSAAMSASRSDSAGVESGVTGTKSTVPAIRVFKPSVSNRVMLWMPDVPLVRLAQFSALPAPIDVTTPNPVATTIGRPALSRVEDISASPSIDRFDQPEAFAAPMPHACDDHLGEGAIHRPLHPGSVLGREQLTMTDRNRGECNIHRKLRLKGMTKICTAGAHGNLGVPRKERALFPGGRFRAGRAGDDGAVAVLEASGDLLPHAFEPG